MKYITYLLQIFTQYKIIEIFCTKCCFQSLSRGSKRSIPNIMPEKKLNIQKCFPIIMNIEFYLFFPIDDCQTESAKYKFFSCACRFGERASRPKIIWTRSFDVGFTSKCGRSGEFKNSIKWTRSGMKWILHFSK